MDNQIFNTQPEKIIPILRLGFRPLFLAAAGFSIVALITWAGVLTQSWNFEPYGGSYWWHAHEMLFGFVSTVVAGFLLTAVQSWTGVAGVKGARLLFLVLLWLSARILIFFNVGDASWWVGVVDLAFLPMAALFLALPIVKLRQYRNLFFIPILLLMTVSNAYMHYGIYSADSEWLAIGSRAMVILVTALMCVLGGRVFPMFTANGTKTKKVIAWGWLEKLSLFLMAVLVMIFVFVIPLPRQVIAVVFLIAALAHLLRWVRWRFWVTFKTPLVWSLHLAYFCIPLGLALFAFHFMGYLPTFSLPMHVITVGGMGGMILSMMSRVSLGHTGRAIQASSLDAAAFGLIFLALIFRTFGAQWAAYSTESLLIAAVLWCVAYGLFLIKYLPMLIRPRPDGRPG